MKNNGFNVLVKTNSYAGNFERELCAFMTGHIGECGVGGELVEPIITALFDGYIESEPDDHGCFRPVEIDDNDSNNIVIFFSKKPYESQLMVLKDRAELFEQTRPYEYLDKDFKFLGLNLIEVTLNSTVIS